MPISPTTTSWERVSSVTLSSSTPGRRRQFSRFARQLVPSWTSFGYAPSDKLPSAKRLFGPAERVCRPRDRRELELELPVAAHHARHVPLAGKFQDLVGKAGPIIVGLTVGSVAPRSAGLDAGDGLPSGLERIRSDGRKS